MTILSSGLFDKRDMITFIKYSNYNVFYNNSGNYEKGYYDLINYLHAYHEIELSSKNNGLWKLKISQSSIKIFNQYFINAWAYKRSFNYLNFIKQDYIDKSIDFIQNNDQVSLFCQDSIEYLASFIKSVFNNINPWKTLVYFSKFISTFLPDLAIPVDTLSLKKIARDYKFGEETRNVTDYIDMHKMIKNDLINFLNRNNMSVMEFKHLDDYQLVNQTQLFDLNHVPLNRPIDKIFYSV